MNRFDIFALIATVFVTLLCASMTMAAVDVYIVHDKMPPQGQVIAAAGWILFTFGPIALAALFWRWAKSARFPWLLHLLLLPCMIVAFRIGDALMVSVLKYPSDADFDSTIGAPIMTGIFLFPVAFVGYGVALIWPRIKAAYRTEVP